jgi:hypothetical protein
MPGFPPRGFALLWVATFGFTGVLAAHLWLGGGPDGIGGPRILWLTMLGVPAGVGQGLLLQAHNLESGIIAVRWAALTAVGVALAVGIAFLVGFGIWLLGTLVGGVLLLTYSNGAHAPFTGSDFGGAVVVAIMILEGAGGGAAAGIAIGIAQMLAGGRALGLPRIWPWVSMWGGLALGTCVQGINLFGTGVDSAPMMLGIGLIAGTTLYGLITGVAMFREMSHLIPGGYSVDPDIDPRHDSGDAAIGIDRADAPS